jgi:hypothetical protein
MEESTCFIKESFTNEERNNIANKIKNISQETIDNEMNKLIQIGKNAGDMSPRSRIGNNVVDYFTFPQRLRTRGKYGIHFYDFIVNIDEFKKKKFIQKIIRKVFF